MGKIYGFLILIGLAISPLMGQEATDFRIRYQNFLKGGMRVIGNQIVNRSEGRDDPSVPYDVLGNKSKTNDEFVMRYVDIDDDPMTFSSSSASFGEDKGYNLEIVYAGLYWAATYPYEMGKLSKKDYEAVDEERYPYESVMFKIPSYDSYFTIKGEAIHRVDDNDKSGAYVCYADVSDLLSGHNTSGEYIVANVRAANGQIEGGVSAGWSLVIVYKNPESTLKKVISYDGFLPMHKEDKSLIFSGFKTPDSDNFTFRLLGASLEGDTKMGGDQISISAGQEGKILPLSNKIRPQRNFFNSSITRDGAYQSGRHPASDNTLGFDIFDFKINDPNHETIPHSAEELHLTFSKTNDRYYMYHTALQIDSQPIEGEEVAVSKPLASNNDVLIKATKTDEVATGYYTIIGVFLNINNVRRVVDTAKSKGYNADYFYLRQEILNYIYTERYDTLEEALLEIEKLKSHEEFEGAWVLHVSN